MSDIQMKFCLCNGPASREYLRRRSEVLGPTPGRRTTLEEELDWAEQQGRHCQGIYDSGLSFRWWKSTADCDRACQAGEAAADGEESPFLPFPQLKTILSGE